jgi:hypothetical protein
MIILSKPFGEFPVNDDWICAKDVIAFLSLGHLKYLGCESALFIPQIVIGAGLEKIFGFSFSLLRCVGWVALFASGVGLFTLLRRTGASTRDAAVGVALLTVFPPSFFNAAGFMTDMIFLSLWIWALVLLCSVDKSSSLAAKLGLVVLIVTEVSPQIVE